MIVIITTAAGISVLIAGIIFLVKQIEDLKYFAQYSTEIYDKISLEIKRC